MSVKTFSVAPISINDNLKNVPLFRSITWQSPNEWTELVWLFGGQLEALFVFSLQLGHGWVDLGREEGQQQVEVVDCQCIGNDVPALKKKNETRFLWW